MQETQTYAPTDGTVTLGGTWTDESSSLATFGSYKRTTVNGSTVTITTPASFPGGTVVVRSSHATATTSPFAATSGGVFGVTLDGASRPAWSIGNSGGLGVSTLPDCYELVVPAGAHTIVFTATTVTTALRFDSWGVVTDDPRPVIVAVPARAVSNSYTQYGGANSGVTQAIFDATVLSYRTPLKALCNERRVSTFDLEQCMDSVDLEFWQSDRLHPNTKGQLGIVRAAQRASGMAAVREIGECAPYGEDVWQAAGTVRTTSGSSDGSPSVPFGGYSKMRSILAMVTVSAVSGTTPTMDLVIEGKNEVGTGWYTIGTFPQITATGAQTLKLEDGAWPDGLRARWPLGGTSPSFTFDITVSHRP